MTTTTENQRSLTTPWIIMAAISGVLIGSSVVRMGACDADDALSLDAARVVQLEAELRVVAEKKAALDRLKYVRGGMHKCSPDPLGGACALSWARILENRGLFLWTFVNCGEIWSGRIDWTPTSAIDPENPVP